MEPGIIIQYGVPPNRIDLINRIDGVEFGEAWEERVVEMIHLDQETFPIYYIGLDSLIRNKKSVHRSKDIEDLKYLGELKRRKWRVGDRNIG